MRKSIIFLGFILISLSANADYGYMELCEMISKAKYCALGTIVKIDTNYFYFKIEKQFFNNLKKDTIQIIKFENWNCGKRIEKYKIGQKELVFFSKSNELIDEFEFIGYGGGDEYEMLIIKTPSNTVHIIINRISDFICKGKYFASETTSFDVTRSYICCKINSYVFINESIRV